MLNMFFESLPSPMPVLLDCEMSVIQLYNTAVFSVETVIVIVNNTEASCKPVMVFVARLAE